MAVPAPRTWSVGDSISAARLQAEISDALNFILAKPFAVAYQATVQTLTTAVSTTITLDGEAEDSYGTGMHSTSTNASRIIFPELGWYQIDASIGFAANATGDRMLTITNPSAAIIARAAQPTTSATNSPHLNVRAFIECTNAGVDYVEMQGYQNSGGNLATINGVARTWMSAQWVCR